MFRIFRKKSTREDEHPKMERAAFFLANAIIKTQTRIANWLSRYEQKMSTKQKKWGLMIFCAGMAVVAGSLLFRGIFNNRNNTPGWLHQQSLTVPKTHPIPDSLDLDVLQKQLQNNQKTQIDSVNN